MTAEPQRRNIFGQAIGPYPASPTSDSPCPTTDDPAFCTSCGTRHHPGDPCADATDDSPCPSCGGTRQVMVTGQAYRDGPPDPNAPLWPGWRNVASLAAFVAVFLVPMALAWWRWA